MAVWIRDVADDTRDTAQALIDEVNAAGVPAVFGPDMLIAAREASGAGWIKAEQVAEVERAVEDARGV